MNENDNVDNIWLWRTSVVVLCALWASNFPVAKLIMSQPDMDSSLYTVARFTTACLSLLPFTIRSIWLQREETGKWISMDTILSAAGCGAWVAFGYLGQTLGLLTTTASKSCVICCLHCVFVAIIAELSRVNSVNQGMVVGNNLNTSVNTNNKNASTTSFDLTRLIPAVLAVIGVGIVELNGSAGPPTMGDLLSFAQPIGFGMGYLQLESIMRKDPDAALPVSFMKLFVVALASMGLYELTPILHSTDGSSSFIDAITNFHVTLPDLTPVLRSPVALAGVLYTGLITTALALWVESIAFKRVPATDASIILTTEPLFAAAIGAFLLGETFGMSDYVGASIIIGACAMSVLLDASSEEEGGGGDGGDEDESNRKLVFGSVNGDGTGTRL